MKIGMHMAHPATTDRLTELIRTLVKYDHHVVPYDGQEVDILIAGALPPHEHTDRHIDKMSSHNGPLLLSSLDDGAKFIEGGLPSELFDRCCGFIQMFWDSDWHLDKQIIINPFIRPINIHPIKSKKKHISFHGLATGPFDNNIRIMVCRKLRSQPWFRGGIVGDAPGARPKDWADVATQGLPHSIFLSAINESRGALTLPGYNPLTYRLFEAMAAKSVAITCRLESMRWLNRLDPDVHYVKFNDDLSDLVEKRQRVIDDERYASKIAAAGHKIYQDYYRLNGDGTLSDAMWSDIKAQFEKIGITL